MPFEPFVQQTQDPSKVTSNFGLRTAPKTTMGRGTKQHGGIDLRMKTNSPLHSPFDGTVVFAGSKGGFGNLIEIQNEAGDIIQMAHLNSLGVKKGDPVTKGQLIASSGSTGNVSGPHLHLGLKKNGVGVDPTSFFRTNENLIKGLPMAEPQKAASFIPSAPSFQPTPTMGQVTPTPLPQRVVGGATVGGVQLKAPELEVQTGVEEFKRKKLVEKDIKNVDNLRRLNNIITVISDVPFSQITPSQVLQATGGDAKEATDIYNFLKAFEEFELDPKKQVRAQKYKEIEKVLRSKDVAIERFKPFAAEFQLLTRKFGVGRIGGALRRTLQFTGIDPVQKSYEGMINEMAASLAKIAAPSARIGESIIGMWKETLPSTFSTWQEFAKQISASVQLAFASSSGVEAKKVDLPQVQDFINEEILAPAMPNKEFKKFLKFIKGSPLSPSPESVRNFQLNMIAIQREQLQRDLLEAQKETFSIQAPTPQQTQQQEVLSAP